MTSPLRMALLMAGLALGGCGFKGPLTLPEKAGDVTVRPAPAATPPAAPADSAKPARPADAPPAQEPPPTGSGDADRG